MTISEECFKTVDVWLDIAADFAKLQGMILAGEREERLEGGFAAIGLTASYGYSRGIVTKEEVEVAKYHRAQIKEALDRGVQPGSSGYQRAGDAVIWAGRTLADKAVACECSKR